MLVTERAIFAHFKLVRRVLFILLGVVITLFAFGACKRDLFSGSRFRHVRTSLLLAPIVRSRMNCNNFIVFAERSAAGAFMPGASQLCRSILTTLKTSRAKTSNGYDSTISVTVKPGKDYCLILAIAAKRIKTATCSRATEAPVGDE